MSRWRVNSSGLVAVPAAAFYVIERAALVVQRVAGRVIGGDEEVERVHRRHAQGAADRFRRSRARVRSSVICRAGGDDAVEAEVIAEHANRVLNRIAAAEQVGQARTAARSGGAGRGVLCALRIVKRDAAQGIGGGAGIGRRARLVNGRAGEGAGLASQRQGQHDLAEAVVVEVFGNHQRLREAHQHAFVPLRKS